MNYLYNATSMTYHFRLIIYYDDHDVIYKLLSHCLVL